MPAGAVARLTRAGARPGGPSPWIHQTRQRPASGLTIMESAGQELRGGVLIEVGVGPALPAVVLRAVLLPGSGRSAPIIELIDGLRGSPQCGMRLVATAPAGAKYPMPRRV